MNEIIKVKTGREVLSPATEDVGEARQVFGHFLYEGEIGILFGDSNAGKSILANEIAFFACDGTCAWDDAMLSPHIPTMYVDMEMTQKQYAQRYSGAEGYIPSTYSRVEVDASSADDGAIFTALRTKIIQMQSAGVNAPKFIIIDNITNGFGSIFSAAKMRRLIADLKTLKARFGLTFLLVAHCPKRKKFTPIEQDSLGGSKMLLNFVDSAFAVANTIHDERVKYIKQIKVRVGEKRQDVMLAQLVDEPYLRLKFMGYDTEACCISDDYTVDLTPLITPEQEISLVNLLAENEEPYYKIAEMLSLPISAVIQYATQNNFIRV